MGLGRNIIISIPINIFIIRIIGMWRRRRRGRCVGRRREREELEDQEGEGGVEMKETTV